MGNVTFYSNSDGGSAEGKDGKSAYELAVENGFSGTEREWLASFKGDDGKGILATHIDDNGNLLIKTADGSADGLRINPETGHLERVVDWESGQQIVDLGNVMGPPGEQGRPGTSLNLELIFSGDANTVGSSYSVTKAITNFKILILRTDMDGSSGTNINGQFTIIPVENITFNGLADLYAFLHITPGGRVFVQFFFINANTFTISVIDIEPSTTTRVGITKIWGVY